MKKLVALVLISCSLVSFPQNIYFPPNTGSNWDTLTLASQSYCQQNVDSLYSFLDTNNTKAFILLKDGKIVLEKYFGSFKADSNWYWASAGKTLTAFLIGIAQSDGFLEINDTTQQYLGAGWTALPNLKEEKITIKDQLSMTTGLDESTQPDCTIDSCLTYLADAGSRWAYHNAPYTLLDSVLLFASGLSINQYMFSKVRSQTGMNGLYLKLGFNNVYFSTGRSMARFGLLLLNKGKWNGSVLLSDSVYFSEMINSSQTLNPSYGYLTWLNGKASFMLPQTRTVFSGPLNADAPSDMFAALGRDGQLINVVPSQNLVWIRMGEAPLSNNGLVLPVFNNEIWKLINKLDCSTSGLVDYDSNEKELKVFPNPVEDVVNLIASKVIDKVELYSLSGSIAKQESVASKDHLINMVSLKKGVYILKVSLKDEQSLIIRKLVVN